MLPEVRLDTDSFKALIEEYRMQIAGIFPEWTNYNYSDPGMTLVELFAWMKENQQFFMEQLSPEHYQSFFRLMGIVQGKKMPAQVAATVIPDAEDDELTISRDTVYYVDDIPYTSYVDNHIPSAKICGIKAGCYVADGDVDTYGTVNIYPFGKNAEVGESMEIYLDRPLPTDKVCYLTVIIKDTPHRNPINGTFFKPLTKLEYEYYTVGGWKAFEYIEDSTRGLMFSGRMGFTVTEPMAELEEGRYAIRLTLNEGIYDRNPFICNMGFRFLRLWQTIEADCCKSSEGVFLGEGSGFPNQRIKLPYEDILGDSVQISVEDILNPGRMKPWEKVDDFSKAGPEAECFVVNENTGEIIFGDGKRGLPPEGRIVLDRVVLSRGFAGTAMTGTVLKSENGPDLMVVNTPVIGKDTETVEEIQTRIKLGKENIALATVGDYERQILRTPGMVIHSCRVLESLSSPTKVTIAVRPGDGKALLKMSREMEQNIYYHLDGRRLIGTDIRLMSPEYIRVNTEVQVVPSENYTDVEKKIKEATEQYFATYGSFGDCIIYGRLYGIIDALDCIDRVVAISFDADKVSVIKNKSGDLIPPANGLFIYNEVSVIF